MRSITQWFGFTTQVDIVKWASQRDYSWCFMHKPFLSAYTLWSLIVWVIEVSLLSLSPTGVLFTNTLTCPIRLLHLQAVQETKKCALLTNFTSLQIIIIVFGSISASGQLPTYPSPNPTLTLTCCQLTVVELGEGRGRWAVAQILILIVGFFPLP